MTDPRDVDYEEEETPIDEQLISAIKYNSVGTFNAVLERFDSPEAAVEYLNTHALAYRYQDRDVKKEAGNVAAHVAASLGQDKIIDELLGQDGFECDPRNSIGDTPLHCAVRWINKEGRVNKVGRSVWDDGLEMIKMMLRDGSDPRIRNKDGHRAEDLVNPENTQLKKVFADFEYEPPSDEEEGDDEPAPKKNGYDYADLIDGDAGDDDDVGSVYSGSDSEEEQEWQRRRAEKSGK